MLGPQDAAELDDLAIAKVFGRYLRQHYGPMLLRTSAVYKFGSVKDLRRYCRSMGL
jgi:hypothetical protein